MEIYITSSKSFGTDPVRQDPAELGAELIYPKYKYHKPLSDDIPDNYKKDFHSSFEVLSVSKKASAALSRRLFQQLLEEKGNIKKDDLANEIQKVIDSNQLPSHLNEAIDAIRNIGNFSTHPIKSKTTGEIVDVEDGEAEWNLDVLEGLFDFYFVQPAATKKKKDALNAKLSALGKPPMKTLGKPPAKTLGKPHIKK